MNRGEANNSWSNKTPQTMSKLGYFSWSRVVLRYWDSLPDSLKRNWKELHGYLYGFNVPPNHHFPTKSGRHSKKIWINHAKPHLPHPTKLCVFVFSNINLSTIKTIRSWTFSLAKFHTSPLPGEEVVSNEQMADYIASRPTLRLRVILGWNCCWHSPRFLLLQLGGCFQNRGIWPPKWMVKILENPY